MSATPPGDPAHPTKINLKDEIAHSEWKTDPIVGFEQRASLAVAQWVLVAPAGLWMLSGGLARWMPLTRAPGGL